MTELEKAVRRRTRSPFAHYRKRIVVILEPGDILAMRLERTRTTYRAGLSAVFRQLVEWHANAERRRKQEERKLRRANR
jgi:hypothetical protein